MSEQRARLEQVLADAGLAVTGDEAVLLPSCSNDTWRIGPLVVRVCWRGDVTRLRREADIAADLPPEVRYPPLVASGCTGDLAWMITRWVDGSPLDTVWPGLDHGGRRRAAGDLADVLQALHAWSPPAPLARALGEHAPVDLSDAAAVVGATLNPLPVGRALALAEHARTLPHVDPAVLDAAMERLRDLARCDPFADPAEPVVVHGDAHMANLLWRDGRITAVLDLEWARLGPPDLELEPFLRAVDWSGQEPESMPASQMASLLGWLCADYPHLFASPQLLERLWLYQLAYTVREICTWPVPGPGDQLTPDHPLNLLPLFTRGTEHLEQLLADVQRRPRGAADSRKQARSDGSIGAVHALSWSALPPRYTPPFWP